MKKLVFVLAVVASASLFSCGSSDKTAEAVDSAAVDTVNVTEAVAVEGDTAVAVEVVTPADSVPAAE